MSKGKPNVIVIGGGVAGLWAAIRTVEAKVHTQIFSVVPTRRGHSIGIQDGINAAFDLKGEGDNPEQHMKDTIENADFLVDQSAVRAMCEAAPGIVRVYDRMGVAFQRTVEGHVEQRKMNGSSCHRSAFVGSQTGRRLQYACDEQLRRLEGDGFLERFEHWEFLSLIQDAQGKAKGITAMELRTMEVRAFPADAVIMAAGGFGQLFAQSPGMLHQTGAAISRLYQQGAHIANAEFVHFHPTAMLGTDKFRIISELCVNEGARLWVPKDAQDDRKPGNIPENERYYFLEEQFPAAGNQVSLDLATQSIWDIVKEQGLSPKREEGEVVYLDLGHLNAEQISPRLRELLEMVQLFSRRDPFSRPIRVSPCIAGGLGGLWVDFERDNRTKALVEGSPRNQATNIPGLYACGESDAAYHGANRLSGNALLAATFGGQLAAKSALSYVKGLSSFATSLPAALFESEQKRQEAFNQELLASDGIENVYALQKELQALMSNAMQAVRDNETLGNALEALKELSRRIGEVALDDKNTFANASLVQARRLQDMAVLGEVVLQSALARDESRGMHRKSEFFDAPPAGKGLGTPEYDAYVQKWKQGNAKWLKSTIASFSPDGPKLSYKEVDTSSLLPEKPRAFHLQPEVKLPVASVEEAEEAKSAEEEAKSAEEEVKPAEETTSVKEEITPVKEDSTETTTPAEGSEV